jgi:microcystin degradation protein MlrC
MRSPNRNPSSMIGIALLGLTHKTNTFSSIRTDLAKFEIDDDLRGPQIVATHATAHTSLAGFLAAKTSDHSVEVVPLMWAWANPSAAITKDAFTDLTTEMPTLLRDAGPWDAVFIHSKPWPK